MGFESHAPIPRQALQSGQVFSDAGFGLRAPLASSGGAPLPVANTDRASGTFRVRPTRQPMQTVRRAKRRLGCGLAGGCCPPYSVFEPAASARREFALPKVPGAIP